MNIEPITDSVRERHFQNRIFRESCGQIHARALSGTIGPYCSGAERGPFAPLRPDQGGRIDVGGISWLIAPHLCPFLAHALRSFARRLSRGRREHEVLSAVLVLALVVVSPGSGRAPLVPGLVLATASAPAVVASAIAVTRRPVRSPADASFDDKDVVFGLLLLLLAVAQAAQAR